MAFAWTISDAIFPLTDPSNSTPNLHSLSLWKYLIARRACIVAKSIHLNADYRISARGHSPGLYPTPYFHFRFPVTWRQTCTAWVYGKYLIARPTYNVAKSIHVNLDYRISGLRHSPGLYPTPYFHLRIPVTRRQTCTAWVYGKYLIASPPYILAKSIHLNSDYRISGRGHSSGLSGAICPLPVPSNWTPNVHSFSLWKIFDRSSII